MRKYILSLFDPQLDYALAKDSGKHAWRPSVAAAYQESFPTHFYLLSEHEHLEAANRLAADIQRIFLETANKLMEKAQTKGRRDYAERLLYNQPQVEVIDISYKNVWNLNDCLEDLTRHLREKNLPTDGVQIGINMVTGTAQQRTALLFWLLKRISATGKAAATDRRHVSGYLLYPRHNKAHPAPAGEVVSISASDPQRAIGFLRLGFDTKQEELGRTLDQIETLIRRAPNDTILLTGPTGAGKSHLAHMIINYLQCLDPRYTEKNCRSQNIAELNPNLIASELFGHEKGAFSGADKQHIGLFEQTRNGVLFLDEIGELKPELQTQLLTVLDNGKIRRVGGEEIISGCRPRLIFGTNRDLLEEVRAGRFRLDLYERIATWHFKIPGIRERTKDIPNFLRGELAVWREESGLNCRLSKDAERRFLDYAATAPWPGNFREFHGFVRRLVLFAENGTTVTRDAVEREIREHEMNSVRVAETHTGVPDGATSNYDLADLAQIAVAIDICRQSKTAKEAGEKLFAATRDRNPSTFNGGSSLQRLFDKVGLKVKFVSGQPTFVSKQ